LMVDVDGDFRFAEYQGYIGAHIRAGLYESSAIPHSQYVIVDEMICASTYELSLPKKR